MKLAMKLKDRNARLERRFPWSVPGFCASWTKRTALPLTPANPDLFFAETGVRSPLRGEGGALDARLNLFALCRVHGASELFSPMNQISARCAAGSGELLVESAVRQLRALFDAERQTEQSSK